MNKSIAIFAALALGAGSICRADAPPTPSHRVVVILCDGLRADSVTEADMPALFALAKQGTRFANHHPVYPSSTEVNAAAIGTGAYPAHDGLVANKEYRPDVELLKPIGTDELSAIRKSDAIT